MDRELKRGPSGHYSRDQWVIVVTEDDPDKMGRGFYTAYLWERLPKEPVWFHDPDLLRAAIDEHVKAAVRVLRETIDTGLRRGTDFTLRDSGITVEFFKDPATDYPTQIRVKRTGVTPARVIEGDFASDWPDGHLAQEVEDAAMELAAIDTGARKAPECKATVNVCGQDIGVDDMAAASEAMREAAPQPALASKALYDVLRDLCPWVRSSTVNALHAGLGINATVFVTMQLKAIAESRPEAYKYTAPSTVDMLVATTTLSRMQCQALVDSVGEDGAQQLVASLEEANCRGYGEHP